MAMWGSKKEESPKSFGSSAKDSSPTPTQTNRLQNNVKSYKRRGLALTAILFGGEEGSIDENDVVEFQELHDEIVLFCDKFQHGKERANLISLRNAMDDKHQLIYSSAWVAVRESSLRDAGIELGNLVQTLKNEDGINESDFLTELTTVHQEIEALCDELIVLHNYTYAPERAEKRKAVTLLRKSYKEVFQATYEIASRIIEGSKQASNNCSECQSSYETLGIDEDATEDDMRRAYKDLCKVWHPDRFSGDGQRLRNKAEEEFKKVQSAYNHLGEHRRLNADLA